MYYYSFKSYLIILLVILCSIKLQAQSSFITKFNSLADEADGLFIQNTNNEFVGIISKKTSDIRYFYLYNISEIGDTVFSRKFEKADTLLSVHYFIQTNSNPIEYLVTGQGHKSSDPPTNYFSFFTKIDENFNSIWEKIYQLRPVDVFTSSEYWPHLLQKEYGSYLFATRLGHADDPRLILFDLSEQGDSLAYRMYEGDSAGRLLMSLTYNNDSTAYLLFTDGAHYVPYMGAECITVDFELNQTDVYHYPRWFDDGLTAKLLPNGQLVTGALYQRELPRESTMAVLKHDTSFNLLAECYVGDPDYEIRKDNGFKSLDYYYPNSIFVAGTFDYDVGIWIQHPSWIVIGKMDSNLNLLNEKYIGGDSYYHFNTITATSDGGALITTNRYDYLTQGYEHDVYIIKLDSLDFTVEITEHKNKKLADAIVYPNPASNYIFVRIAISDANFALYDMAGNKFRSFSLTGLITQIRLDNVPSGTYTWSVYRQSINIETGKLIITN